MFPRQAGIKKGIEIINAGTLYYYLPDLDFGPKRSVFVPFFGVPAATVTGLAYIARDHRGGRGALRDADAARGRRLPSPGCIRRGLTFRAATTTPTRGA